MAKVLVLGMGKSGCSAYLFLQKKGDTVFGVDGSLSTVLKLKKEGFAVGESADVDLFDSVVVSPGIPASHPLYALAVQKGKKIQGEISLGLENRAQICIGITGTNGKTTVTSLITHVLNESGQKAVSLGNIGTPLTHYEGKDPSEILVLELSSYQIETLSAKAFHSAIVLNITPDHLDRYSSMDAYAEAKLKLQMCLKEGGKFFVNEAVAKEFAPLLKPPYCTYGLSDYSDIHLEKEVVKVSRHTELSIPQEYFKQGMHEIENIIAAWAICRDLNVKPDVFLNALSTFKRLSHRIELVAEIKGVKYYDDSKGTNIDATVKAVLSMSGPVILIAGGVDKGASYSSWHKELQNKIKAIVVIGQAAGKIKKELSPFFKVYDASFLKEAVQLCGDLASPCDCVLLSPGCSSFDMFRDYVHRGEEFKKHVHELFLAKEKENE